MKEGPSGSAIRSLIPSHRKLLWSKSHGGERCGEVGTRSRQAGARVSGPMPEASSSFRPAEVDLDPDLKPCGSCRLCAAFFRLGLRARLTCATRCMKE